MHVNRASSSLSLSPATHLVLLPGRSRWLHACHLNPVECDQCLERVAEFLADELHFDLNCALEKTTLSYRAELGEDVCSLLRAGDLKRMTCEVCMNSGGEQRAAVIPFPSPVLRFDIAPTPFPAPRRWEKWRRRAAGCLMWPLLIALSIPFCAVLLAVVLVVAFGGVEE